MTGNQMRTGILITGDASGAIKQIKLTEEELDRLNKAKERSGNRAKSLAEEWGKSAKAAVMWGSAITGVTVGSLAYLVKGSVNAAAGLEDLRAKTGLSIETLAGLRHAAKLSGSQLESTAKAVSQLSKRMGEDAAAFRELGISATDPLEAFKQVSARFGEMADIQERAAFANKVFGKSWEEVAPLLEAGPDKIDAMVRAGQRMSGITTEMAERAGQFEDNLDALQATGGGWVNQITNSLLPALVSTSEWMLKIINHQEWLEQRTTRATEAISQQAEAAKSIGEVANLNGQASQEVERITARIAELQRLGAWGGMHEKMKDEITVLNAELAAQQKVLEDTTKALATYREDMADVAGAYEGKTAALQDLNRVYEESAALVLDGAAGYVELMRASGAVFDQVRSNKPTLKELDALWGDIATATRDAGAEYVELMRMSGAAMPPYIASVEDLDAVLNQTAKSVARVGERSSQVTEAMEEDWRLFRDSLGDLFAGTILDPDGDFFDRLGEGFRKLFAKVAGDLAASGLLTALSADSGGFSLSATLANAGTAGKLLSGGIQKFAPSLGYLFGIGGNAVNAAQAAALNLPASAASSSLSMGLSAAAPWLAGAVALAAMFDKKSTPSFNAGLLLQSVPGAKADQLFNTEAFASGLEPIGFARRATQQEAEQTIELFRQLDRLIVDAAASGGWKVNPLALMGYSETGLGNGVFLGGAGEDGRPGTALDVQMGQFAKQLIGSLRGQIEDRDLDAILAAGGVDEMIAKLKEASALQKTVADDLVETAKRLQMEALSRFDAALTSARSYIDEMIEWQRQAAEEQRRLIEARYAEEIRMAEALHGRQAALFRNLMDYTTSLRLGNLSGLSGRERLDAAQLQVQGLLSTARNTSLSMSERVAAAEGFTSANDAYLQAYRDYKGSAGYRSVFEQSLMDAESLKFLGSNREFDPTPYENAMLAELQGIREGVTLLPDSMASRLNAMMYNVVVQAILAGKSMTQVANIGSNLAVTGGPIVQQQFDQAFKEVTGKNSVDYATQDSEIAAQVAWMLSRTDKTEEEKVRLLAAQAGAEGLSSDRVAQALAAQMGVPTTRIDDLLAKYGIDKFAAGGYHRGGWAMVGEEGPELVNLPPARVFNARDTQQLLSGNVDAVGELRKVSASIDSLARIVMAGKDFDGQLMTDQTRVLESINRNLSKAEPVGSARYANANAA